MNDISIVLCGEAGQGIATVERLLTRIAKLSGLHVFATKEFMSRIRGGSNSTEIRIASERVRAFVNRIDIFIPLSSNAVEHVAHRLSPQTLVISQEKIPHYNSYPVPINAIARELGNAIFANIVAVGVVAGLFSVPKEIMLEYLAQHFGRKGEDVVRKNHEAATRGYDIGTQIVAAKAMTPSLNRDPDIRNEVLMDGSEAVALGAIASGCNFIAAYPMTPSSGVWTFLAQHAKDFGIITEQTEDEISAMNMAIGAWYAGGRALVTTSGGGFDLMTEGLSLVGAQESPMVIHLAQRPGPATGLPTRTEQADLNLALYAGHGEFPRIILAPGTIEDGFFLTQKAFNLADRYQVPVFVLTDQYFVDSYYNFPKFDIAHLKNEQHISKTNRDYKRYALTEDGISPRGIPGYGDGFVNSDCHVHDEQGHISESMTIRKNMVEKILRKAATTRSDCIPVEIYGSGGDKNVVVCWGSTYHTVQEALDTMARDDVALLHCKQLFPLHPSVRESLNKAQKVIAVENNATGQFAELLRLHCGIEISAKILTYTGLPFAVEEVIQGIENYLRS